MRHRLINDGAVPVSSLSDEACRQTFSTIGEARWRKETLMRTRQSILKRDTRQSHVPEIVAGTIGYSNLL